MKKLITSVAILLLTACAVSSRTQGFSVPSGCSAAPGAQGNSYGWADRVIHDRTGVELIFVPAGSFMMGSSSPGAGSNIQPVHQVTFSSAFYMGKTEITNAQYRTFINDAGYDGTSDTDPAYDLHLRHFRGLSLMSQDDGYPIVWVSWRNARAFCDWAVLALPSESEWEYACRAGTTTDFYFGSNPSAFAGYAWTVQNSEARTHPVAQKLPNAWGLHDMLGNVWEWCEDDYVYRYEGAPVNGSARIEGKMTRVLRGGSWGTTGTDIEGSSSVARHLSAPGNAFADVGFRVVIRL